MKNKHKRLVDYSKFYLKTTISAMLSNKLSSE